MSEFQAFENWQSLNESIEIDPEELKAYERQYKKLKNKELINQVQVYVKSIGTNLKYSLEDIMGITLNKMLLKDQSINLLGQQINQDYSQEQVRRLMLSLSWFSYRKNMPFIISKEGKAFSTDANWGCTIRVIQMFLYSVIWEHLERKYDISKKYHMKIIKQIRNNLLKNFFDNNLTIFSLHKFCSIGLERNNADVGQFWRPNITVSNMMRIMQKNHNIELYKDKDTLITFNTNEIVTDLSTIGIITQQDIFQKIFNTKKSCCKCIKKQNKNWEFYTMSVDLSDKCLVCDFNKTLIIFCFLRTGLVKPEPENVKYIRELIESKFFAGGVIGKGNSAFFLLGNQGSNYIYLDPHYVQESNPKNSQNLLSTYNVQNFRTIDENSINPCVGLALRAKNFKEFQNLKIYIEDLSIEFKDSFYLSFNCYDENMQLYSQLINLNYNMKLKILFFVFCFLSKFKTEDMAEAEPMQEAIEEEAQHPEDDVNQSPVDEEEGEINPQEENNVLKSEENIAVEQIQGNLEKCKLDIEECLNRIEDSEWNELIIEKCIGPDHLKIKLVINYERDRILSKYDNAVKKAMWKTCYSKAGDNLEMSQSCDEIESDTIDFLWSILDFARLLDINRSKYTEEMGSMGIEDYEKILDKISKVQKELFQQLTELESQSSALIVKIDNFIDEKTETLRQEIEEHPEKARMLKKTKIVITTDTPLNLDLKKLPKKQSALLDHLLSEKYISDNKNMFTIDQIQKRQQARQLMKDLKMGEELKKLKNVAPKNWMKQMLRLSLLKKRKVGNFIKSPHINVHEKYRKNPKLKFTKIKK